MDNSLIILSAPDTLATRCTIVIALVLEVAVIGVALDRLTDVARQTWDRWRKR